MNLSDWLNLLIASVAIIVSVLSLKQSEKAIKLTEKSIDDANRPYLACYLNFVDVGYFQKYLVIKNFGSTPAVIHKIEFSDSELNIGVQKGFSSLENTTIAPGQKFVTTFDGISNSILQVDLSYKDMNGNLSKESFNLNTRFAENLAYSKQTSSSLSDDQNDLRVALHSMSKNNL